MKEAVGESAMTIITIVLIAGALGAIAFIIGNLLSNQKHRADCENAGYIYSNGQCKDTDGNLCNYDTDGVYICGWYDMKESTGSVAAIYIVIFFVIIVFGFIISTLSYYKSYKINNSLSAAIDDYGGFNSKSKKEIENRLDSYGYQRDVNLKCKKSNNNEKLVSFKDNKVSYADSSGDLGYKGYCVYLLNEKDDYKYYSYKITTYLTLDFGLFDLRFPYQISSKTSTMYSCYGLNCEEDA